MREVAEIKELKTIDLEKTLEILTKIMVSEDYDMLGCIDLRADQALMLYGDNSSNTAVKDEPLHVESYSEALEWFVNNAVVEEERERFKAKVFIPVIKEALAKAKRYEFLIHVLDKKGERRTKKIRYICYNRACELCLFTQIDVTELLLEEERKQERIRLALLAAKHANAAKSEFLTRMSHDIRTPLNVILGMSKLAEDNINPVDTDECLRKIGVAGEFLLGLVNDVLDMERIESGRMEINLTPYSGERFAQYINAVIRPLCAEKNIYFEYTYSGKNDFVIMQDELRINQIYFNLLSNAVKFTPEGGKILFHTDVTRKGDTIALDVIIKDNGVGMSKKFQEHLYEAFSQEYNADGASGQGSGLGLSIVKRLCDLMEMTVSVESRLGKGTTFFVHGDYAIAPTDGKNLPEPPRTNANLGVLKNKKILVCEDHPMNQEIIKRLLKKVGVVVDLAGDGRQGLDLFEGSKLGEYAAVLMDIRMPIMDGLRTTRALRKLQRKDAVLVPIIAMTANAYEDDVKKSLKAGMNAHLAKPINPELLYETLAQYIG